MVLPAIAGIRRLENVTVVAQVVGTAGTATGAEESLAARSRAVDVAGRIDREISDVIELIAMVDEILAESPAGAVLLQRENCAVGELQYRTVEIASAILDQVRGVRGAVWPKIVKDGLCPLATRKRQLENDSRGVDIAGQSVEIAVMADQNLSWTAVVVTSGEAVKGGLRPVST